MKTELNTKHEIVLPPILFDPGIDMLNDDKLCAPSDSSNRDVSKTMSESKVS